ncbi:cold-shock dna-binding domain containing protein [Stylonychia lemnae]|uniref:Cold-shock dna-binding domain containing protein n=1 Tax=Stylonychia lemnae TaxID=5949 RepID=A0A078B9M1_STYLE|nr:cold-shock dna-binding domain containing protein [Stylonychia lemnae]|eukprot:CDW91134.1 cold-shock dna-binding domain containing protein [Stylonychia lemnae]
MMNLNQTSELSNINNSQQLMGGYMPTLIDKMKEDILRLKALCRQLKESNDQSQSQQTTVMGQPTVDQQQQENDERVQKWINERKYLLIKTELEFNQAFKEGKCTDFTCKQVIESIDKGFAEFDLMIVLLSYLFKKNIRFYYLRDLLSSFKQNHDDANSGSIFGELNLCYDMSPEQTFLKLYIRSAKSKSQQQFENNNGLTSENKKIHLDLICNEFEYEILYKRAFQQNESATQESIVGDNFYAQAQRHKRGYSQGNYSAALGVNNASPASHLNLFGSPSQLKNHSLIQPDMSGVNIFQMNGLAGMQVGLNPNIALMNQNNPQTLLLQQQQQEELQKLLILKQQAALLQIQQQQQQLLYNQMLIQNRMPQSQGQLPPNLMPPPGLGAPSIGIQNKMPGVMHQSQNPPMPSNQFAIQNPQIRSFQVPPNQLRQSTEPMKGMHSSFIGSSPNPLISGGLQQQHEIQAQIQQQQMINSKLYQQQSLSNNNLSEFNLNNKIEEVKVEIISDKQGDTEGPDSDPLKKSRRTASMDVSSKVFIPSKRNSSAKKNESDQQTNLSTPSNFSPSFANETHHGHSQSMIQPGMNAYDIYNKIGGQEIEDPSANIDYRVTGRLKFFNEGQSYGFIVSDIDGKDLFFHFDDMKKTNLSKQFLKDAKNRFIVRFSFKVMGYYGKYSMSKKAVDIDLIKIEPINFQSGTTQATLEHINGGTASMLGATGLELAFQNQLNLNPNGISSGSFILSGGANVSNMSSSFITPSNGLQ